jgi:hypothetical protein
MEPDPAAMALKVAAVEAIVRHLKNQETLDAAVDAAEAWD